MEEKSVKTRDDYLRNLEIGVLVAFRVDGKMMSAKVIRINDNAVEVETKNGSVYFINKQDIAWVKTGKRWPAGIFNALRSNVTIIE